MSTVEREVNRVLVLLRNKIRERGLTQQQVHTALGWGKSYISQLLTKQKALRFDQVLLILETIGVDFREFFAELYSLLPQPQEPVRYLDPYAGGHGETPLRGSPFAAAAGEPLTDFIHEHSQFRAELRGVVELLIDKDLVTLEEVLRAAKAADHRPEPR